MDFSSFVTNGDPVVFEILNPATNLPIEDENGNKAALVVVGTDSEQFKKARNKITNTAIKRMNGSTKIKKSAEEIEAEQVDLLCACVVDVQNISLNGMPVSANKESLKQLFEVCPFVFRQLEAFVYDEANFIKAV
ncbi:MAG: hypothetical protein ABFD50_08095 [Smithella sp.]